MVLNKNMNNAIMEIHELSKDNQIILILDELDRLSVKRGNSEEISELKRAFIEFLDFLDGVKHYHQILIIGITNSLDFLDTALIRRFDFIDEIKSDEKDLVELFKLLVDRMNLEINFTEINIVNFVKKFNTGDKIKKYFKHLYIKLEGNNVSIEKEIECCMRGVMQ